MKQEGNQDGLNLREEKFLKARHLVRGYKTANVKGMLMDPNIVGAAFGRRTAHGEMTDEPALVVYVMKKVPQRFLPISKLLPRRFFLGGDCVEVDVVETGPMYTHSFTARERPAPNGVSVAHFDVTAGTLGSLVMDNTDGSTCILSNRHVLAATNSSVAGDNILQPGSFDGGVNPGDAIATLKRFIAVAATGNQVDCAIAQVNDVALVVDAVKDNIIPVATADHPAVGLLFAGSCNRTIMNPIDTVLNMLGVSFFAGAGVTTGAEIGMNVEKVGRTTEYTSSTIKEVDVTVTVGGYDVGPAVFENQITTGWMSDPGDSGSLVYQGGDGGDVDNCGCGSTSAAEEVFGASLRQEQSMADVVRDKFLRQTRIGRYAIDLFFLNEEAFLERFRKTRVGKDDKEFARKLREKYQDEATQAFVDGDKSDKRLTDQHLRDAQTALKRAQKFMAKDEIEASEKLFAMVKKHGVGKNAREILALLNNEKLLAELKGVVSQVKSLKQGDCGCQ